MDIIVPGIIAICGLAWAVASHFHEPDHDATGPAPVHHHHHHIHHVLDHPPAPPPVHSAVARHAIGEPPVTVTATVTDPAVRRVPLPGRYRAIGHRGTK